MDNQKPSMRQIGLYITYGILGAAVFLFLLPIIPLRPGNPFYRLFGIHKPIVLGFMPYWLLGKVTPKSFASVNRVTYFGLALDSDGTFVKLTNPQETDPGWHALNTGLFSKTIAGKSELFMDRSLLLHVGNESTISALLLDPLEHAVNLVAAIEPIMKRYEFTDVNLDVESFLEASPDAQLRMSAFVRHTKEQLVKKNLGTLTVELTVASLVKNHLLVPEQIGSIADRVVLMAYDYHYSGSYISGAVAPIGGAGEKWEYDVGESVKLASRVIAPEKIVLGIPLYGYEWETLTDIPESAVIPGTGKTATAHRIGELKKYCVGCKTGKDTGSGSPYLILPPNDESAYQQVFVEDKDSIQQKIDLATKYKLGGVALWALGYEDDTVLAPVEKYSKRYEWIK